MRAIAITLGIFSILCVCVIKVQTRDLEGYYETLVSNNTLLVDNENLRYQVASCRQLVREQ